MNVHRALLLLAAVGLLCLTASAQETRLIRGKVKPERPAQGCDNQQLVWSNITVKVRSNGQSIQPDPQSSQGEDWSRRVPVGATVKVGFFYACYRPWHIPSYTVTAAEPQTLRDAVLSAQDRCLQCPSRAGSTKGNAGHRPVVMSPGVSAVIGSIAAPTTAPGDSKPSPERLLKMLREDADTALEFEALDIFQYNFEALSVAFGNDRELADVLHKFRGDTVNVALFRSEGNRRPETFRNIIKKQFYGAGRLDFPAINELLRDPSIDPSIKGSAVVALLDSGMSRQQEEVLRDILHPNLDDTSGGMYLTSVIALARLGGAQDSERILADVTGPDAERAVGALTAMRVTQMTEGPDAFASAISAVEKEAKTDSDPGVRLAAIKALRPSVFYRRLRTAIQTLSNRLEHDEDEQVRAEAALALGLGSLECRDDVKVWLLTARRTDSSSMVQAAADNALKGAGDFQPGPKCRHRAVGVSSR